MRDKATDVDYRMLGDPEELQRLKQRELEPANEDQKSNARIRAVKRERPDGSIETTYELVNANGVTIKTGMSKETAGSLLKHYKQKYGQ